MGDRESVREIERWCEGKMDRRRKRERGGMKGKIEDGCERRTDGRKHGRNEIGRDVG